MNDNTAILHYNIYGKYYRNKYRFDRIQYFVPYDKPTPGAGHTGYTMDVIIIGMSGEMQHATYFVSGYPQDRIIYEGREYRPEEFKDLIVNVYNSNVEHDLEALE